MQLETARASKSPLKEHKKRIRNQPAEELKIRVRPHLEAPRARAKASRLEARNRHQHREHDEGSSKLPQSGRMQLETAKAANSSLEEHKERIRNATYCSSFEVNIPQKIHYILCQQIVTNS